jgi:ubiquinone/menaquinone biosynthesis C-methylase UbiE
MDKWTKWIIERRFGGDEDAYKLGMQHLYGIRDRILQFAVIQKGEIVLDVGCGDGLLGNIAIELVSKSGRVIFVDISSDMINALQSQYSTSEYPNISFYVNTIENLSDIKDSSIDVVVFRSVLCYVKEKAKAIKEIYRILRAGVVFRYANL